MKAYQRQYNRSWSGTIRYQRMGKLRQRIVDAKERMQYKGQYLL